MRKANIIEPASGQWASPIALVRKKRTALFALWVDYRRLNAITRKDAYPIPRIDDSIDTLAGSKYFTTLDLASGYWQVPMNEEDREKTTFASHCGLYQFRVMPFVLCNAPSTFERLMEKILHGRQWQICPVFNEHIERPTIVFHRIRQAGLKLKPEIFHLLQQEVLYLGHIVSDQGVRTDPSKTCQIHDWPVPRNTQEVSSFLGLSSYYRRFVAGFAVLAVLA